MKTLYLDCAMGAAGDMLTAALLELLPDPSDFVAELNALGLPGVEFEMEKSVKCGVTGTHMAVRVHGEEEGASAHGEHHDEHVCGDHAGHSHDGHHGADRHCAEHHDHSHSGLEDITRIVGALPVSEEVRRNVREVYALIALAESAVHGVPVEQVHFHEVGALDAVADVTAVCLLMERIAPEQVIVSPVHVGSGQVRCAHGILPVPAPATARILKDVPIYGGSICGELCTPTGVALLKHFADGFGAMPIMRPQAVGYGMGRKDFEAANCVRAILGETDEAPETDEVFELQCNLDDMTPEALGFALERLFAAGARDAFTVPAGMKKNRPGVLLCAICDEAHRKDVLEALFRHTTTLGVRETACHRYVLHRSIETVQTPMGDVRRKIAEGCGVRRAKYEYEDVAQLARENDLSIHEVIQRISTES